MNSCLKSGYLTLLYYWLLHQWCSYQEMVYCTDLNLPIKLKAIVILFQTDPKLVWIIRNKYLVTPLTYLASHLYWIRRLHHVQHLRYKSSWRERILPPTKGNNQNVRKCKRLCQSSRRIVQGRARVSGKLQQFNLNSYLISIHFCIIPPQTTMSFTIGPVDDSSAMWASLYARSKLWFMDYEVDYVNFGCLFVKQKFRDIYLIQVNPEAVWIPARKGDKVPDGIIEAGSNAMNGPLYVGRSQSLLNHPLLRPWMVNAACGFQEKATTRNVARFCVTQAINGSEHQEVILCHLIL